MIIDRLPGIEKPEDVIEMLQSIENSKYPALRRGRIKAYDAYNEIQKALCDITFAKHDDRI